jgi:N-acetylglucosamine-6-sulfatase
MVQQVRGKLRRAGELRNTLIVFTSDNGWLLGEHRVVGQKYFGFEESIEVPLILSGPGFPRDEVSRDYAMNVDLAPTILAAARARAGRTQDGYALQRVVDRPGSLRERDMVIETGPNTWNLPYYSGLHTRRYAYEEITTGETELYDLRRDPHQLVNVASDPGYLNVRTALHRRLQRLSTCRGRDCRSRQGSPRPG